jgi:hypothetical protein
MNTPEAKPLNTHSAERTLYQVQVRQITSRKILINEKLIGKEWEIYPLPPNRGFYFNEFTDTAAEIWDNLFPFALAMKHAWEVLALEHGHTFDVRLVPHVVKTSYASYPQEPLLELDRNPA